MKLASTFIGLAAANFTPAYLYGGRVGGANGAPNAAIPTCNCKKFEVYGNNFDGIYTMEGYYNDEYRGGVPTPYWAMYRKIDEEYNKRYLIFYQNNNKWWVNWELNNDRRGWSYSEKTMLCPDQCDPKWQNCSGDGMQFICLDDDDDGTDPVTTPGPRPTTIEPEPASVCRDNHLYDQDFVLYDSNQEQSTYPEGTTVDVSCAKYTYPTLNRAKVGAVCTCDGGDCNFVPKKDGFKCVHESVCPLPNFQGAKFNYVIDSEPGADWAYVRFRFRSVLDNVYHPEWNKEFWKDSPWTGIVACPFSSSVAIDGRRGGEKKPISGIYFETASSAYEGKVHTVMGRDGHRLLGKKGEVLRAAILTPDGSPWETKFKGYTCEIGVVPGHHPNLAKCLEEEFGDHLFEHFQTAIPSNFYK